MALEASVGPVAAPRVLDDPLALSCAADAVAHDFDRVAAVFRLTRLLVPHGLAIRLLVGVVGCKADRNGLSADQPLLRLGRSVDPNLIAVTFSAI